MEHLQDATRRSHPSTDNAEKKDEAPHRAEKAKVPAAFFRRRIRLKGDSTVSMPLALVLLFPLLVIGLIFTLFWRSPDVSGLANMPAGTPPSIRYVLCLPSASGSDAY
jgi:mannosyltransferase|tara:strand:+ start:21893 stop:22216 length:324 start_codon:yes stop_codon:yes gene_type:complete